MLPSIESRLDCTCGRVNKVATCVIGHTATPTEGALSICEACQAIYRRTSSMWVPIALADIDDPMIRATVAALANILKDVQQRTKRASKRGSN